MKKSGFKFALESIFSGYPLGDECQDIDNKKMCQHIDKSSLTIE